MNYGLPKSKVLSISESEFEIPFKWGKLNFWYQSCIQIKLVFLQMGQTRQGKGELTLNLLCCFIVHSLQKQQWKQRRIIEAIQLLQSEHIYGRKLTFYFGSSLFSEREELILCSGVIVLKENLIYFGFVVVQLIQVSFYAFVIFKMMRATF